MLNQWNLSEVDVPNLALPGPQAVDHIGSDLQGLALQKDEKGPLCGYGPVVAHVCLCSCNET